MTPGSIAWRNTYARGLHALQTLHGGGAYSRGAVFGPPDNWSNLFVAKLQQQGLVEEVSEGMYRAPGVTKLGRILSNERQFSMLIGCGVPDYASGAEVLSSDKSLLDSSRVVERMVELFGAELLQKRFGIASPRLRAMRAVARMSEAVAVAFGEASLSGMHAVALIQGPADERTQLALIDIARAHALSARELQSIASRVRNGISLERAVSEAGVSGTPEPATEEAPASATLMTVPELAASRGVSAEAIYARIRRRKTGAAGERIDIGDGLIAIAPEAGGESWMIDATGTGAEQEADPVDDVGGHTSMDIAAASLKVSMACLEIVQRIYARVDFLARELGYKEDGDVSAG